jgi:hypothetical protein
LEIVRVYPPQADIDGVDVGTIWDLPCEMPYCFLIRQRDLRQGTKLHRIGACPIMRTAVAVYGDQCGQGKSVKTDMRCTACQCGVGIFGEYYEHKKCEHCLDICYCSQRTFEEVGYVRRNDGVCMMKVSDMEKMADIAGVKGDPG